MKIPNADKAVIAPEKLRDYLLNPEHPRGGAKASVLMRMGYRAERFRQLEADLRGQHLRLDYSLAFSTEYGQRYELRGPILTPSGRTILLQSVWQIDTGSQVPRLITLYPD